MYQRLCEVCSKLDHQRMPYAKFDSNWPNCSEEDFLHIFNKILLFHYHLPLKKGVVLHLNKL